MRIDKYLALHGFAKSRETAQKLLENGVITVGGRRVKPSLDIDESSPPEIEMIGEPPRYVSRGGLKLERALDICMFEEKKYTITGRDTGATCAEFADYVMDTIKGIQ